MTQYFGIQRCIVVAGDSDIQRKVLSDFGDVNQYAEILTKW